jgi:hypothetical protein
MVAVSGFEPLSEAEIKVFWNSLEDLMIEESSSTTPALTETL